MSVYYITGNAGTGKSTVVKALRQKGYEAYDVDETSELHGFLDTTTGEIVDEIPPNNLRGEESFSRFKSVIKPKGLNKFLKQSGEVFLAGSVTNQAQYYNQFTSIFGLYADRATIQHRLATRTNNPTGRDAKDREFLVSINERVERSLRKQGAIMIDATHSIDEVLDTILAYL